MATINFDSELLRQPWEEKLLDGALDCRAVHDYLSRPVIFTLLKSGKLLLLAQDDKAELCVLDLSAQFGLKPTEKVSAIAVSQAKSLEIHVVFATTDQDAITFSKLWVLPGFVPASPTWLENVKTMTAFQGPQSDSSLISKLLLGSSEDEAEYPFLAAVVNKVGNTKKDVFRIDVNVGSKTWQWATDLEYPFNIDDMVDFCVGRISAASGIFGLDNTFDKPTLTFAGVSGKGPGPRSPYRVNLPVVANPKAIATTLDEDGLTNVLVCGDGILHIASQNCIDSVPSGTVYPATINDETLQGVRKVELAQQGRDVALWVLNGDNNLIGISRSLRVNGDACDELFGSASPIPLFPKGDELHTYDAIVQPDTKAQQVICLKKDGTISSLHQNGDSKLWSEQPLRVPDPTDIEDVNMYSCQIRVQEESNDAKNPTYVELSSSSQISCLVNGRHATIGTSAVKFKTDVKGTINLNIRAPDLVAPTITIAALGSTPISFNPATKAIEKLSQAARSGKLSEARNPNGGLVFPNADEKTSKAIAAIGQKFIEKTSGVPILHATANSMIHTNSMQVTQVEGAFWQFWHGICAGVEAIKDFFYEAGVFIIETAKKVWKFVVETAEQALSALSGLFKLLETALEDALVWLAETLDWESITDVVTIVNEAFNTGLDLTQELIGEGGDWIDVMFAEIEAKVGSWHLPPEMPEQLASLKPNLKDGDTKKNSVTNSPGFNWVTNTMDNSQKLSPEAAVSRPETDFVDVLETIFDKIIKPLRETLEGTFSNMWKDFKKLFDPNDPLTWKDILKNIGVDVLLGMIQAVRKAVHGILAVSSKFIAWIQTVMNKPMKVWIISKVYKKVSGRDLTIMDLSALLIAVPTVWIMRLFHSKKPRDFEPIASLLKDIQARKSPVIVASGSDFSAIRVQPTQQPAFKMQSLSMVGGGSNILKQNHSFKSQSLQGKSPGVRNFHTNAVVKAGPKPLPDRDWETKTGWEKFVAWAKYFWRGGFLLKTIGSVVFTALDSVNTIVAWKAIGSGVPFEHDAGWKKGSAVYLSVVMIIAGIPIGKLNRPAEAIAGRFWAWGITGAINVYKSGLPTPMKPPLAACAGAIDAIFYAKILYEEGGIDSTDKTDTILEATNRLLVDAWAIGSCINGISGGSEPYSFYITLGVGAVMNLEGMVLANQQFKYFEENCWKDDFHPPSFESSLNGSLM